MSPFAWIKSSAPVQVMIDTTFGPYLVGNTVSLVGTWMQRIACSWLVWDWTGSAFWVGLLAACDLMPVVFISPLAGVLADRWDRLRLNVNAQVISIANAALLAVLFWLSALSLGMGMALTLIQGILTAITQPSRFAMVQQMVSRDQVGAAVGLNSACVNIARLVGPAIAGAMILHWSIGLVFALNAIVTILFVGVLRRISLRPITRQGANPPFVHQLIKGFAYTFSTPALRLILLALFAGGIMVRSVVELMPVIAANAFREPVLGLAVLTGAAAIGAILSGVTMGTPNPATLLRNIPLWWGIGAVAAVGLTTTGHHWVAALAAALLGGAITKGLVSTQTFMQLTTPDDLRGRALSVFGLFARGSPALGALAIGYAADHLGVGNATLAASALLIALQLGLSIRLGKQSVEIAS